MQQLVTGTLIYAILDTLMDPQRVDNKRAPPSRFPSTNASLRSPCPFLARYGSMLETTGYRSEKVVKSLPGCDKAKPNTSHRNFFDVREWQAGRPLPLRGPQDDQ
jgi:hypothetical protein